MRQAEMRITEKDTCKLLDFTFYDHMAVKLYKIVRFCPTLSLLNQWVDSFQSCRDMKV